MYFIPKRWARLLGCRSDSCAVEVEERPRRDCVRYDFRHDLHIDERKVDFRRAIVLVLTVVVAVD